MDGCDYSFSGLKTAVRSHWHPHCGQSAHNSPSAELKSHLLTPTIFQSTMLFVHNMTLCVFFFSKEHVLPHDRFETTFFWGHLLRRSCLARRHLLSQRTAALKLWQVVASYDRMQNPAGCCKHADASCRLQQCTYSFHFRMKEDLHKAKADVAAAWFWHSFFLRDYEYYRAWSVDFSWCFQPSRVYIDVNLGCVVGVPGQVPKCGRAALVWTCFTCCRLEHGQVQMNLLRLFCTACYAADTPFLSCMLSVVVNLCSERNVPHSSNMEI